MSYELWYEIPVLLRTILVVFGIAALFPLELAILGCAYRRLGMLP